MNLKDLISNSSNSTNGSYKRSIYQSSAKILTSSTRNQRINQYTSSCKQLNTDIYSYRNLILASTKRQCNNCILPKPKQTQLAFITKVSFKYAKRKCHSVNTSKDIIESISSPDKIDMTTCNVSSQSKGVCKLTKQHFSTIDNTNANQIKFSSRLQEDINNQLIKKKLFQTSLSSSNYYNNNKMYSHSTSLNNTIGNVQKHNNSYLHNCSQSMTSSTMSLANTITNANNNNNIEYYLSKTLRGGQRKTRSVDASKDKESLENHYQCNNKNTVILKRKHNTIDSNDTKRVSKQKIVSKYFDYNNFINKKKECENKLKTIERDNDNDGFSNVNSLQKRTKHSQSLPSNKYQRLISNIDDMDVNAKNISPNKQLISALFKNKIETNRDQSEEQVIDQSRLCNNRMKGHDKHNYINNSMKHFQVDTQKELSLKIIPVSTQTKAKPQFLNCQIHHNETVNYHNTTNKSNDNHEEIDNKDKEITRETHNNIIIEEIDKEKSTIQNNENTIEHLERVFSSDKSMLLSDKINPTQKIQTFPHYENTIDNNINTSQCNNENKAEEKELDLSSLVPIQTEQSLQDSQSQIKLHVETKPIPHLFQQTISQECSITSKGYKSTAPISNSVESILVELHTNIQVQLNVMAKYDYTQRDSEDIQMLFHISNKNSTYLKKLISVENIIPKGNLRQLNKMKSNSTLQEILLNELVDIRSHKEATDNINLLNELINKNNKIIQSIMKQYKCH